MSVLSFITVLLLRLTVLNEVLVQCKSFSIASQQQHKLGGGGRAPSTPDKLTTNEIWDAKPNEPSEARLIVLQITDVYTLDYLASFKTLVEDTKKKANGAKVVCMLTGDFLSPYLLSSLDRGFGMMRALGDIPMDYLTWGNHEADVNHRTVCQHVREFQGKWINSNMLDHEAMDAQVEYDVVDVVSPDGSNHRKIGLCAVLSDDPALYSQFKEPGAFGGATVTDPWEALTKYKRILEEEEGCDLVLPLQHLYVPDDHKTCRQFDFPVVLSGHDHHRVDEVVEGTRLIKPGMNGVYSTVLEISWPDGTTKKPTIRSQFVTTEEWEPDAGICEKNDQAYSVIEPLRNTELARVPVSFEPLSSNGSRETVCTMGKYICSLIKSSLNVSRRQRRMMVDAVILMGGNLRGNTDYKKGSFFSLEALEAEIKSNEVIAVVSMPGWLLADGIQATHSGDPIPGWMQYDVGIEEDYSQNPPVVTHVAGELIDRNRIYRVATKIGDLTNGQSPPLKEYFTTNPDKLPPKGAYVNIHAEIFSYFARNLWRKIWDSVTAEIGDETFKNIDDEVDRRFAILTHSSDANELSVQDIQQALRTRLGYSVDDREATLAEYVYSFADTTGNGKVSKQDFQIFCQEMAEVYENDKWRLSYPKSADVVVV